MFKVKSIFFYKNTIKFFIGYENKYISNRQYLKHLNKLNKAFYNAVLSDRRGVTKMITARQYLNKCRALGVEIDKLLERKERMLSQAIYSSPNFNGNNSAHSNESKIQNITDEMLQLDTIIEMFQNERQKVLKNMMCVKDMKVRQVLIKFYFDCCSYTQITKDTGIPRSTVKRKLKEGIAEMKNIVVLLK